MGKSALTIYIGTEKTKPEVGIQISATPQKIPEIFFYSWDRNRLEYELCNTQVEGDVSVCGENGQMKNRVNTQGNIMVICKHYEGRQLAR